MMTESAQSETPVPAARVLVVEDDPTVREVVERYLEREGIVVDAVSDGLVALEHAESCWPDLVVLDLMLPGLDGLEVCRRLRAQAPVPVIMLTARGDEDDRVMGLELGADDYIAKPFSPRELTLRVQAVLRRAAGSLQPRTSTRRGSSSETWTSRFAAHEVSVRGEPLSLTAREFDLLVYFASRPRAGVPSRGTARSRCGASPTATPPPSPCTCVGCARRSKPTRRADATSRRSGVWATGGTHEPRAPLGSSRRRGRRRWRASTLLGRGDGVDDGCGRDRAERIAAGVTVVGLGAGAIVLHALRTPADRHADRRR